MVLRVEVLNRDNEIHHTGCIDRSTRQNYDLQRVRCRSDIQSGNRSAVHYHTSGCCSAQGGRKNTASSGNRGDFASDDLRTARTR